MLRETLMLDCCSFRNFMAMQRDDPLERWGDAKGSAGRQVSNARVAI
jgi:hypothetical protein